MADAQCCLSSQAHDSDQPGTNNSHLYFSLLPSPYSHNFSVDPDTGLLRNLGPLDREAIDPALGGRIVLTVRVADGGMPPLSTQVNVTITVEVRPGSARGMGPGWALFGGHLSRWPTPQLSPIRVTCLPFVVWWVREVWSQTDRLESWLLACVALGNYSTSLCPTVTHL